MIKVVIWILFLAFTSYALFCALLYTKQRSMLYYPSPRVTSNPADVIWLENEGQTLKVWHVKSDSRKALIYFGGNAEDVTLSVAELSKLFPQHALYIPHYRGYGGSSGKATEEALYSDAMALFVQAAETYDSIVVMGRSLGTGVAVYLASQKAVDSIILVTPFDSMTQLASSHYPYVPVSILLKDKFDSVSRAADINIPTLVLIAEQDEVIPRKNSDRLVAGLNPSFTSVQVLSGTGHNNIETSPLYDTAIKSFLDSH